ncbi:MAG: AraC family ligand binding domain-containing protein [Ktedonobacteraceae bacterium]
MRIIRWQEPEAPREQTVWHLMQTEGLRPYSWSNGPGVTYALHSHSYEKVLYCVKGSIRFMLHDTTDKETNVELAPGDCMILAPDERHSALVGAQGVTCMEAAREV